MAGYGVRVKPSASYIPRPVPVASSSALDTPVDRAHRSTSANATLAYPRRRASRAVQMLSLIHISEPTRPY